MFTQEEDSYVEPAVFDFDAGVEVLPLGLVHKDSAVSALVFQPWSKLIPSNYTEEALAEMSDLYWKKHGFAPTA